MPRMTSATIPISAASAFRLHLPHRLFPTSSPFLAFNFLIALIPRSAGSLPCSEGSPDIL